MGRGVFEVKVDVDKGNGRGSMKRGKYIGKDLEGEPMYELTQGEQTFLCVISIGLMCMLVTLGTALIMKMTGLI